jgi:hypothetical protein
MSTKATIAYGENFHFYHECFDEDHVYLELETTQFEAGYGRVMVPIPLHIWETIRHLGNARLDLVNQTDEDLRAMVETEVDRRIAKYQEALRRHPGRTQLAWLGGSLVYSSPDKPRGKQIPRGMEYFTRERQRQREVAKAIKRLRRKQSKETQMLLDLDKQQIAADLLIMLMKQVSREMGADKWREGIEYLLWEAATGQDKRRRKQGQQARYLAEKCHGWVCWDKEASAPKFIPLGEWGGHYCEWVISHAEGERE